MKVDLRKPESKYNPFDLFSWLNLGSWESLLWEILQFLAIIFLMVIILTSLWLCNLSRVLNAFQQTLISQTVSIRIRELEEFNDSYTNDDDSNYMTLYPN